MATAAATVALLPVTAAYAAGTVTAPTPSVVSNGGPAQIAFTTSDTFNNNAPPQVTATGPGATGTDTYTASGSAVTVNGSTVTATINFAPNSLPAGPGGYSVEICQPVNSGCSMLLDDKSAGQILTVTSSAPPSVSGLSQPVRAQDADTTTAFLVNGTFAKGDTVTFVPQGNNATPPTLTSLSWTSSQISGTLTGLTSATPGAYDTVVKDTETGDRQATSQINPNDVFTVVASPAFDGTTPVSPAASVGLGAGQNGHPAHDVTLHVNNLTATDPITVSFPSATNLTAVFKSATATQSGADVVASISTASGATACAAATASCPVLTVKDSTTGGTATQEFSVDAAPTISSTAPSSVAQGVSKDVEFTGDNMDAGARVSFPSNSGLVASQTQTVVLDFNSTTHDKVTANVAATSSAATGPTAFTISNGDGGATDYTGGSGGTSVFSVTAAPQLSTASPASVTDGTTNQVVTLNGSGFQNNMTVTTTNTGVTLGTVQVSSATQATVPVSVAASAPTGPIVLKLTNPDGGTSTSSGKLTIDAFGVSSISPTSASNGGSGANAVALTISGTNIPTSGTTLQLTRLPDSPSDTTSVPPINVSPSSVTSTTWKGTANLVGAAAGNYQVRLVSGTNSGTCGCQFTVTSAGAPTVTSVSPASLGQGAATTLIVNGTGFTQATTVTFGKVNSADSVTPTGPTVFDSPTKVEIPVQVAANAPTGSSNKVDVIDTNPGPAPNTFTCTGCLTINPAPTITSFSPTALAQGASTALTITGTNFDPSTAKVTFGSGITQGTGSTTVTSTQIKTPVKVDPSAPSSVLVTVTNGDFGTSPSKSLTINPGPKVTSVSPQYVANNFSGTLTITGSAYHSGATVSFPSGSGVATNGSPTISSDGSTITQPVKVTRTDAAQVDVTVTNNDDQGSVTLTKGLGVAIAPKDPTNVTATRNGTSATVAWTAVPTSDSGGAPITGYTVSVTAPAGTGLSDQKTTGTSVTYTGLSSTTDYTFKVVATNAANLSSPGASATTSGPLGGTTLSLGTTAAHLTAGQHVTLGGALSDGDGSPIGGATITLLGRTVSGTSVIGATTTAANGSWSMFPAPRHTTTYTASYAGSAKFAKRTSSPITITVAPKVTISAPQVTAATTKLAVTGSVSPNKAGHTVHLIAVNSHGVKKTFAVTLSGSSTYKFKVKLAKGKWTLVVTIGSTSGNTAGHSHGKTIKRT